MELYCCYSLNLRNYLHSNGLRYKLCALNPNSQKRFWVYIKDEKLNIKRKKRWKKKVLPTGITIKYVLIIKFLCFLCHKLEYHFIM